MLSTPTNKTSFDIMALNKTDIAVRGLGGNTYFIYADHAQRTGACGYTRAPNGNIRLIDRSDYRCQQLNPTPAPAPLGAQLPVETYQPVEPAPQLPESQIFVPATSAGNVWGSGNSRITYRSSYKY